MLEPVSEQEIPDSYGISGSQGNNNFLRKWLWQLQIPWKDSLKIYGLELKKINTTYPGNGDGVNCEFVRHGNCQNPFSESYTIRPMCYFQPKVNNKDWSSLLQGWLFIKIPMLPIN